MVKRLCCLAACAAAACGGPASPSGRELTGYFLTFTPSPSCSALYPRPFPIVLARGANVDGWHWFASMGTTGGPQAPSLALRLRNTIPGYVDGLVSGGTQTSELPPRLLMFSTQTFPFLSPSPPLPFEGAGDVGSEITGILAGAILGTSTFPGTPCFAFDHMLRLVPVFEELQQS